MTDRTNFNQRAAESFADNLEFGHLLEPLGRHLKRIEADRLLHDKSGTSRDTDDMNDISRPELDTKLQLIEERLDRKVADIATSIDNLKGSNKATQDALNNAKWWAIGTAIAVLAVFLGTLQWGLSAQKDENARFSSYMREDVKSIADDMKDVAKTLTDIRVKLEPASNGK